MGRESTCCTSMGRDLARARGSGVGRAGGAAAALGVEDGHEPRVQAAPVPRHHQSAVTSVEAVPHRVP